MNASIIAASITSIVTFATTAPASSTPNLCSNLANCYTTGR